MLFVHKQIYYISILLQHGSSYGLSSFLISTMAMVKESISDMVTPMMNMLFTSWKYIVPHNA